MQLICTNEVCKTRVALATALTNHQFTEATATLEQAFKDTREKTGGAVNVTPNKSTGVDGIELNKLKRNRSPGSTPLYTKMAKVGMDGPSEAKETMTMVNGLNAQVGSQAELVGNLSVTVAELNDMIAAMKSRLDKQDEVIESMKSRLDKQDAVIESQNVVIAELKSEIEKQSKIQPPKQEQVKHRADSVKENKDKEEDKGPSYASQVANGKQATQQAKEKTAADKARMNALKRRIAIPEPKVVKMHFKWASKKMDSQRQSIKDAKVIMAELGVASFVKEVSLIGKSVVELYVVEEHAEMVKKAVVRFAGGDPFIPEENFRAFQNGKLAGEELTEKIKRRITFLCARNPSPIMQECILRGTVAETEYEQIKLNAAEIRAKWARPQGMKTAETETNHAKED